MPPGSVNLYKWWLLSSKNGDINKKQENRQTIGIT